jgi:hypothetical protein
MYDGQDCSDSPAAECCSNRLLFDLFFCFLITVVTIFYIVDVICMYLNLNDHEEGEFKKMCTELSYSMKSFLICHVTLIIRRQVSKK